MFGNSVKQSDDLDLSMTDWLVRIDLERSLRFLETLPFQPDGYQRGLIGIGTDTSITITSFLNNADPDAAFLEEMALLDAVVSTASTRVPEWALKFALGHVSPAQQVDAAHLARFLAGLGAQTWRHAIRMGIEYHASKHHSGKPQWWMTKKANEVANGLAATIKARHPKWSAASLARFQACKSAFYQTVNR